MPIVALLLLTSCSPRIYPDRGQFLKDGDPVPTVDLNYYKSVQERPGQDSTLAVAMAISGGGSRASNFGIGIMLGLEQISTGDGQDMLDEVDYLSTVSGGGFAAGAYVSALYDHQFFNRAEPFSLKQYLGRQIREDMAYPYTGVLVRANFNPVLWFSLADDGDALERSIDEHVLGYRRRARETRKKPQSLQLSDFFVPAGSPAPVRFPMHITNSSTLNTMTIFPFTPDILSRYRINGYTHRLNKTIRDTLDPFSVPLAVGIKSSASFPVLISNTTLCSKYSPLRPFLPLIDGAMTDNIGYYTALQVLKQERAPRKVLLIVDADAAGNRYTFSKKEGAVFSLRVMGRLPSSGLDARRATLVRDIRDVCRQYGITPVFFSFNALLDGTEAPLPEEIMVKEEQKRLIWMIRRNQPFGQSDRQILYELLTHIGTKLTITDEEQELLLYAGQLIVKMQEEEVKRTLKKGKVVK
ncbi:MAG: patatin-like phospholipase family protein [Lewinellaceae bacterium]|nr:patatin-like phospholipase family protein [Lewinellaceae bacterium]